MGRRPYDEVGASLFQKGDSIPEQLLADNLPGRMNKRESPPEQAEPQFGTAQGVDCGIPEYSPALLLIVQGENPAGSRSAQTRVSAS